MMSRALWALLVPFGFSVILSLQSCIESKPPLKVSSHVWPGYEFLFLGKNLGILDPDQVSLLETNSASESLELIESGNIDAAALTLDEVLRARSRGTDLVVVMVFDISAGADVLLAKPEYHTIEQLRGKRWGVETSGVGSIMLDQALAKCGCSREDVSIVDLSADQHAEAWNNNELEAVITYEPVFSQLMETGARKLFSSRETPNLIVDVLAVRRSSISRNEAIEHLIGVHFSALEHFHIQKDDALFRLASRMQIEPADVLGAYRGLLLPNLRNNLRLFASDNSIIDQASQKLSTIMYQAGIIPSADQASDLFEDKFLRNLEH